MIHSISRHGSTDANGEKVFRGWQETPENQLSDKGILDSEKLGNEVKKLVKSKPDDFILISSDLNRASDTATIVSKISGVPIDKEYKEFRSQDTGSFSGQKENDVKQEVEKLNEQNKPLPNATESYNEFIDRIKNVFPKIEQDYPDKKVIIITHHQVEVLQANNFDKATEPMFEAGLPPGGIRPLNKPKDKHQEYLNNIKSPN